MKKKFLIIWILLLSIQFSCITDQKKYKETELFEEFESEEGFAILHLPPIIFKLFMSVSHEGEKDTKELINKVEVVKIMFFEEKNASLKITDIQNTMNKKIADLSYNLLTRVAQESNDVSIYIIEKEKMIHEVLIIIVSDKEYIGLNLVGSFTKEEVFKVYQTINMDKIKNFEK